MQIVKIFEIDQSSFCTSPPTTTHLLTNTCEGSEARGKDWDSREELHRTLINIILCKDRILQSSQTNHTLPPPFIRFLSGHHRSQTFFQSFCSSTHSLFIFSLFHSIILERSNCLRFQPLTAWKNSIKIATTSEQRDDSFGWHEKRLETD